MIAELHLDEKDTVMIERGKRWCYIHIGEVHVIMSPEQLDELEEEIKEANKEYLKKAV